MLLNEKLPSQVWEFSAENCLNGRHKPHNIIFVPCLAIHTNSLFQVIFEELYTVILPFSSSKHCYSCLRLPKVVTLSQSCHVFAMGRYHSIQSTREPFLTQWRLIFLWKFFADLKVWKPWSGLWILTFV